MNIRKETIERYRKQVDDLVEKGDFEKGLAIASKYPLNEFNKGGYVITKTRLLSQYQINLEDLSTLCSVEKDNPHYKVAPNMILFFEPEVRSRFKLKDKYTTNKQNEVTFCEGGELRSHLEQLPRHHLSILSAK
jgi:hypothetical protein